MNGPGRAAERTENDDGKTALIQIAEEERTHLALLGKLFVPRDMISGDLNDIYTVKPIKRLQEAREQVLDLASRKKIAIGIVGGGPSAVEIAGNLRCLTGGSGMHAAHIKIITGSSIIARHPSEVRKKVLHALDKQGIEIVNNCPVREIRTGCVAESFGKCHARWTSFSLPSV